MEQHSLPASLVRATPRLGSRVATVCFLLLTIGVYDAAHVHQSTGPLENAPLAPHHCLLCLAAHLPVTISAGPALPLPRFTWAAPVPPIPLASYEPPASLSLYIRPPPLG